MANLQDENRSDEIAMASYVTLARIYDLVAVIARASSLNEANKVIDAHEKGVIIGPLPALTFGDEE